MNKDKIIIICVFILVQQSMSISVSLNGPNSIQNNEKAFFSIFIDNPQQILCNGTLSIKKSEKINEKWSDAVILQDIPVYVINNKSLTVNHTFYSSGAFKITAYLVCTMEGNVVRRYSYEEVEVSFSSLYIIPATSISYNEIPLPSPRGIVKGVIREIIKNEKGKIEWSQALNCQVRIGQHSLSLNKEGKFEISLPVGNYTLSCGDIKQNVQITSGQTSHIDISLPSSMGIIQGTLVETITENGVVIWKKIISQRKISIFKEDIFVTSAFTDEKGFFKIMLPAAQYTIKISEH